MRRGRMTSEPLVERTCKRPRPVIRQVIGMNGSPAEHRADADFGLTRPARHQQFDRPERRAAEPRLKGAGVRYGLEEPRRRRRGPKARPALPAFWKRHVHRSM